MYRIESFTDLQQQISVRVSEWVDPEPPLVPTRAWGQRKVGLTRMSLVQEIEQGCDPMASSTGQPKATAPPLVPWPTARLHSSTDCI